MRKLEITNAKKKQLIIQQEILRSEESRYDHRLHGVLMISRGMSRGDVAGWLGQDTTTVERWVKRFNADGCDGLREGEHTGRPKRLTAPQWDETWEALRQNPRDRCARLQNHPGPHSGRRGTAQFRHSHSRHQPARDGTGLGPQDR